MESGRKGRKVIRLGPVPLGRDSEEKGEKNRQTLPWGVRGDSHIMDSTFLGFYSWEMSPLG